MVGVWRAEWDSNAGRFAQRFPFGSGASTNTDFLRDDWLFLEPADFVIISAAASSTTAVYRSNLKVRIPPTKIGWGQSLRMVIQSSQNSTASFSTSSFQRYRIQRIL
jgi:hypothetical protein